MTKEFAIIEEMPLPEEKREELDKLMERVNELTGCAVLLIHPSTQKAVSGDMYGE